MNMETSLFFTIHSSSSRHTIRGLRVETSMITLDRLIESAAREMSNGSSGFEEMAGIKFIESAGGDFEPERMLTDAELIKYSAEKLGDDGRLFEVFPDDETGRKDFLETAGLYGLSEQAEKLIEGAEPL